MGEMIKFGIKVGLTVATAVALCSALFILFNYSTSIFSSSIPYLVRDIFAVFSLVLPININALFSCITILFSFKVAYWAADKMLWLIDVLG